MFSSRNKKDTNQHFSDEKSALSIAMAYHLTTNFGADPTKFEKLTTDCQNQN